MNVKACVFPLSMTAAITDAFEDIGSTLAANGWCIITSCSTDEDAWTARRQTTCSCPVPMCRSYCVEGRMCMHLASAFLVTCACMEILACFCTRCRCDCGPCASCAYACARMRVFFEFTCGQCTCPSCTEKPRRLRRYSREHRDQAMLPPSQTTFLRQTDVARLVVLTSDCVCRHLDRLAPRARSSLCG